MERLQTAKSLLPGDRGERKGHELGKRIEGKASPVLRRCKDVSRDGSLLPALSPFNPFVGLTRNHQHLLRLKQPHAEQEFGKDNPM